MLLRNIKSHTKSYTPTAIYSLQANLHRLYTNSLKGGHTCRARIPIYIMKHLKGFYQRLMISQSLVTQSLHIIFKTANKYMYKKTTLSFKHQRKIARSALKIQNIFDILGTLKSEYSFMNMDVNSTQIYIIDTINKYYKRRGK